MEITLAMDPDLALVRVMGEVGPGDGRVISSYLADARRSGAHRAILDVLRCPVVAAEAVPPILLEAAAFAAAGGSVSVFGLRGQCASLLAALEEGTVVRAATPEEAEAAKRLSPGCC